jgi:hypothetical protein
VRPTLLVGCGIIAAGILGSCSDTRIAASAVLAAAPPDPATHAAVQPAKTDVAQQFANAALDEQELGGVRGGFSTGSGMVVNFSFQEATYANHNLTQNVIVPTMTVSPGSASVSSTMTAGGSSVVALGSMAQQAQVGAPSQVVQSIANSGMTSVFSSLGGGVTNHISNTANNQLVQQVITANIGVTGLGQAMQQGVASTVMSRVRAATSQFR